MRIKAGIDVEQMVHGRNKQSGTHQKNQREAITSAVRGLNREEPVTKPRPPSFGVRFGDTRVARNAGTSPNKSPVSVVTPKVNKSRCPSTDRSNSSSFPLAESKRINNQSRVVPARWRRGDRCGWWAEARLDPGFLAPWRLRAFYSVA